MNEPKWKPDPLPERRGSQLTAGRIINLWSHLSSNAQGKTFTISVSRLFLDKMDYAMGVLMMAAVSDNLGSAKIEPRGMNKDFEISWTVDSLDVILGTPGCIYDFLKACAIHAPMIKKEAAAAETALFNQFPKSY